MRDEQPYRIFDRAILIEKPEELEKLLANPEQYLRSTGALDGLPGFNGVVTVDGRALDSLREGRSTLCLHNGVPFKNACQWQCQVY